LWFTNHGANTIGRITQQGLVTSYPGLGTNEPVEITSGPDGALWFANDQTGDLGRTTTAGKTSAFATPDRHALGGGGITVGPDHAIWFTYGLESEIGRMPIS
jgi:virginiamycin B lyase